MDRISRRKFLAAAAASAGAAALAAACGGDDGYGGGSAATSTPGAGRTPASGAGATATTGADNAAAGLRWFGQSMFLLTSPGGTRVLLDPFGEIGYTMPAPLNTDVATITHEHPDHNNGALGGTGATVLRGLTADGWTDIDESVGDVRIRTVRAYHDDQQGAVLGRNAIFVYDVAGLRIVHLGDLGHQLDDAQRAAIGGVDVLMVPVGGSFSIGHEGASAVTAALAPKMVFPMHYKTDKMPRLAESADAFLQDKTVQRVGATDIRLAKADLPPSLTAYVLDYE